MRALAPRAEMPPLMATPAGDAALLWLWYGFMLGVTAVDALALTRVVGELER